MKNFSYIHVEKLRVWDRGNRATREYKPNKYTRYWGVTGCWEHDMRTIETANAIASRFAENSILCSETEWKNTFLTEKTCQETGCLASDFIAKKARNLLSDHKISAREDQVKVSMLLMAISPEYLRNGDIKNEIDPHKVSAWKASTVRFLRKKFDNRLLAIVFHEDELNPHASAYVLPLIQKEVASAGRKKKEEADKPKQKSLKWRLSHNEIFTRDPYRVERDVGGKRKKIPIGQGTLSLLQEEYAEELKTGGLNVRRGVRRAPFQEKLKHETNRERYERLTAPVADVEGMTDTQLREWAVDASVKAAEASRLRVERDHYQTVAADAQEQRKMAQDELSSRQRIIPVREVISQLTGLDPRPTDKPDNILFVMPDGQKISINEATNRFQNLTPEIPFSTKPVRTRGRGAIDAVQFLTGWSFEESTEWLSDTFSAADAVNAAAQKAQLHLETSEDTPQRLRRRLRAEETIQELETPDPSNWTRLVENLFLRFRLSLSLLNKLHAEERVFANRYGHMIVL